MKKKKKQKKSIYSERCIFCGKSLPEGYGQYCGACFEKIMQTKMAKV